MNHSLELLHRENAQKEFSVTVSGKRQGIRTFCQNTVTGNVFAQVDSRIHVQDFAIFAVKVSFAYEIVANF